MRHAIKAALATIIVPGGAVILVPYLILRMTGSSPPPEPGLVELVCLTVAGLGAAMVIWVSVAFVRQGRGTPVPIDPPREFVATGLFRFVRNPMYLGVLTILVAEAVYFRSWLILGYALALWLAFHILLIVFEEPQLLRRFGESYRRYLSATPRWFPRVLRRT